MDKEVIGAISGAVVFFSAVPYAWRTYQKKIKPEIASWLPWTILSLTIALSCRDSGAVCNVWPAVFGFVNPLIITVLAFWAKDQGKRLVLCKLDWLYITICVTLLMAWAIFRNNPEQVQFVLYGALVANTIVAIPTIMSVKNNPGNERPFSWALLLLGHGLGIFALNELSIPNMALPVYIVTSATWIVLTLSLHRVRNKIQIREWI